MLLAGESGFPTDGGDGWDVCTGEAPGGQLSDAHFYAALGVFAGGFLAFVVGGVWRHRRVHAKMTVVPWLAGSLAETRAHRAQTAGERRPLVKQVDA